MLPSPRLFSEFCSSSCKTAAATGRAAVGQVQWRDAGARRQLQQATWLARRSSMHVCAGAAMHRWCAAGCNLPFEQGRLTSYSGGYCVKRGSREGTRQSSPHVCKVAGLGDQVVAANHHALPSQPCASCSVPGTRQEPSLSLLALMVSPSSSLYCPCDHRVLSLAPRTCTQAQGGRGQQQPAGVLDRKQCCTDWPPGVRPALPRSDHPPDAAYCAASALPHREHGVRKKADEGPEPSVK